MNNIGTIKRCCLGLVIAVAASTASANGSESGSKANQQKEFRDSVTEGSLRGMLGADPKEIMKYRRIIRDNAAARNAPVVGDYDPAIIQEIIDLDEMFELELESGEQAPRINIARYQSTAVSFIDAYGNPWAIRKVSSFLDRQVEIDRAIDTSAPEPKDLSDSVLEDDKDDAPKNTMLQGESGTSINDLQAGSFTVTALKNGVTGNITVYLHGLAKPISVMLVSQPATFHKQATIKVNGVSPSTPKESLFQDVGIQVGVEHDSDLNSILYGVTPTGAERMHVDGVAGQAWVKGKHLYLRTSLSVFSPKIVRSVRGNGKYTAYKLPLTTRVSGSDEYGRTHKISIKRLATAEAINEGLIE
uniref:Intercellular transfer by conjugation n=1 Tax=uncultured bacterium IN-11 TaxID=1805589 RepID=A0A142BW92_9BACT|nr:intercellular transfer by conjugation [uncultured bacterium IN-11]